MGPSAAPSPWLWFCLTLLAPFGWLPGPLSPPSHLPTTRVATPQQLFFSGEVKGESAMRSERDVGSKVKYEVTVSTLLCGLREEAAETCLKVWALFSHGSMVVALGFQASALGRRDSKPVLVLGSQ